MDKQLSPSDNLLKVVFDDQGKIDQSKRLNTIAESVSALPANVIDQMLAYAANELEKRKEAEKDEAILKILEMVKRHNIPFDELHHLLETSDAIYGSHSNNGKTRKLYTDPDNNMNTWTGVGRRPDWIRLKIDQGHNIEDFAAQVSDEDNQRKLYFFNPKKPTQRWNGLGRKPYWYKELEASGFDIDQCKTYF